MQTWCKEVGVLVLKGSEEMGWTGAVLSGSRVDEIDDVFPIRFWEKSGQAKLENPHPPPFVLTP